MHCNTSVWSIVWYNGSLYYHACLVYNVFSHPLTHTLPSTMTGVSPQCLAPDVFSHVLTSLPSTMTGVSPQCLAPDVFSHVLTSLPSTMTRVSPTCLAPDVFGQALTSHSALYYTMSTQMFGASLSTKAISWTHLWPCKCIVVVSCVGLLHDIAVNLWDKANYKPRVGSALHGVHQVHW